MESNEYSKEFNEKKEILDIEMKIVEIRHTNRMRELEKERLNQIMRHSEIIKEITTKSDLISQTRENKKWERIYN